MALRAVAAVVLAAVCECAGAASRRGAHPQQMSQEELLAFLDKRFLAVDLAFPDARTGEPGPATRYNFNDLQFSAGALAQYWFIHDSDGRMVARQACDDGVTPLDYSVGWNCGCLWVVPDDVGGAFPDRGTPPRMRGVLRPWLADAYAAEDAERAQNAANGTSNGGNNGGTSSLDDDVKGCAAQWSVVARPLPTRVPTPAPMTPLPAAVDPPPPPPPPPPPSNDELLSPQELSSERIKVKFETDSRVGSGSMGQYGIALLGGKNGARRTHIGAVIAPQQGAVTPLVAANSSLDLVDVHWVEVTPDPTSLDSWRLRAVYVWEWDNWREWPLTATTPGSAGGSASPEAVVISAATGVVRFADPRVLAVPTLTGVVNHEHYDATKTAIIIAVVVLLVAVGVKACQAWRKHRSTRASLATLDLTSFNPVRSAGDGGLYAPTTPRLGLHAYGSGMPGRVASYVSSVPSGMLTTGSAKGGLTREALERNHFLLSSRPAEVASVDEEVPHSGGRPVTESESVSQVMDIEKVFELGSSRTNSNGSGGAGAGIDISGGVVTNTPLQSTPTAAHVKMPAAASTDPLLSLHSPKTGIATNPLGSRLLSANSRHLPARPLVAHRTLSPSGLLAATAASGTAPPPMPLPSARQDQLQPTGSRRVIVGSPHPTLQQIASRDTLADL